MLSEEEKRELLQDGRRAVRRDHFRQGTADAAPLSMEQYLQWLADLEQGSPAPPPTEVKRYSRILL